MQLQRRIVEACGTLIDSPATARAAIGGGLFALLLQRALLHVKLPSLVSHQGLLQRAALLGGEWANTATLLTTPPLIPPSHPVLQSACFAPPPPSTGAY